ncbi:pyrimidine reductase family protein [Aeromicrobium phragmitis]|uniref:Pyrimidine reductase family protein n=1 Tax=Aeromicrobium phragmitis TaxID=2478914 RepID=A0A3L8PKT3_9ACTN|nr:pyrimidine reductase family protein [Aeromicrobium phragmitis]RLV55323.1 pyrimidine reductase family protein [Aeromicrobium phragmitis]
MLDIADLERRFSYPDDVGRAWVRTAFVSSIDGSATDRQGRSGDLGGEPDEQLFALLRSLSDVILVAAGTVRAERYAPVKPEEVDSQLRERLGLSPVPPIAVISASLDIPDALVAPGQLLYTCSTSPSERRDELAETMDVVVAGERQVDCRAVVDDLAARGLRRVSCEGGPTLHGELIAQDLVDEVCLTIGPILTAGPGPRIAHGDAVTERTMRLAELIEADGVLLTRWMRDRSA